MLCLENGRHSVSVNSHFCLHPCALHYNSFKAFLYLLLFLSYTDTSRQGWGNSKSSFEHQFSWVENIKSKTQSLEQRAWQVLQLSTRTRKQVHQLSSSPNERTRSWGSDPFVFPPSLSSMWGRKKERSETQDLAALDFATLEAQL